MMQAHANLGELLLQQFDLEGALAAFSAAIKAEGKASELWRRRGLCEYQLGAFEQAFASYQTARTLAPTDARTALDLASVRTAQQRYRDALPFVRESLALQAGGADAENLLLYLKQQLCDWEGIDALFERQRARLHAEDAALAPPHNFLALPYTPAELRLAASMWARMRIRADAPPRLPAVAPASGKLRIAYFGPDFRAHPLANLLSEVIELHDRSRFEISGYAMGRSDGSEARARFARAFDHFHDVASLSTDEIVRRIRDDGVSILLDTSGYVIHARPEVLPPASRRSR